MDVIVGLGSAGCRVAEQFSKHPQYKIYKIDTDLEHDPEQGNYKMPELLSSEAYEKDCPDLSEFFSSFDGDTNVTFVMAGGGKIAGSSLQILEKIKHCNLDVVYITPDIALLGGKRYVLNRITFFVLQEYARSGLLNSVSLIYNPSVEAVLGEVPVRGYYDKLNEVLVSTMHMINVFTNTEAVFKNLSETEIHHRINSFGIINSETGEEKMLFPLDKVREKVYYMGINEKSLMDGSYFSKLKASMREKAEEEDVKISFQINETKYDENYVYFRAFTDEPQDENKIKKFLTNESE